MPLEGTSAPGPYASVRSWLTVSGGDETSLASAARSEADGFMIGLESAAQLAAARRALAGRPLFVCLDDPGVDALAILVAGGADGLAVRTDDAAALQRLSAELAVVEAEAGCGDGSVRILARIGSPRALFGLGAFRGATPRLAGLIWEPLGFPPGARATAANLVALAAEAAQVVAIDGTDVADAGFADDYWRSREAGFHARRITRPQQAGAVRQVFGDKSD